MFGIDLFEAAFLPSALVALIAGTLSFVSPCVLPVLPPYLAYMSGVRVTEIAGNGPRLRVMGVAVAFVLGLSTVFLLLGFAASAFGRFILSNQGWFNTAAALTVMVFGLHFLGILRLPFLDRDTRIDAGDQGGTAFGAYILGLAFAFGWAPCIGPQLGLILSLAAQGDSLARGTALLGVYAAGLGLPFLAVAAFLPRLGGAMSFLRRHANAIERVMGLFLWTIGLTMLTGGFTAMSFWLLETFPGLATLG